MSERETLLDACRDALIQAVNGNLILADQVWELIHAWDDLHDLSEAVRVYVAEPTKQNEDALARVNLRANGQSQAWRNVTQKWPQSAGVCGIHGYFVGSLCPECVTQVKP